MKLLKRILSDNISFIKTMAFGAYMIFSGKALEGLSNEKESLYLSADSQKFKDNLKRNIDILSDK